MSTNPINVVDDGGADNTSLTDAAASINAALSGSAGRPIFLPEGTFALRSSGLSGFIPGQEIYGAGEGTVLLVDQVYAGSVLNLCTAEPGPFAHDFTIKFVQPDTALRTSLLAYPPAIKATGTPRFRLRHIKIAAAQVAIDASGNTGGAEMDELEISAFSTAIYIDGAMDTIRIRAPHIWPFGLTANQQSIMTNAGTTGMLIGRVDGLQVSEALFYIGTGMSLNSGATGDPWVLLDTVDFDSFNGIVQNAGSLKATNIDFTLTPTMAVQAIKQTGGRSEYALTDLAAGPSSPAVVSLAGGDMAFMGGEWVKGAQDLTLLDASSTGLATVRMLGVKIDATPNITTTNPLVHIRAGARATLHGNRVSDKGSGSGTFIKVDADEWHSIVGNRPVGWTNSLPAPGFGYYAGN